MSARRRAGLALALLGGCGAGDPAGEPGAAPERAPRATNVYVISLDSASARYLEPWGAEAGATPHVAALARESVVFDAAYSQTATTVSSVASLLTGLRATTHRVEPKTMEPLQTPTLPERLRDHGWRSFGFVANPMAGLPRLGFHRGYEVYQQIYADGLLVENPAFAETPYKLVFPEDVRASLERVIAEFGPTHTFAYFHYLQPHTPYDPPPPHRDAFGARRGGRGALEWPELQERMLAANERGEADAETIALLEARYRANLAWADAGLGALLDALRDAGRYDDALIVLTADHGEAFFGHGRFGHNWTLYDDMLRVPLLMRFPPDAGVAPRRIAVPTETVDLLPTLLDFLGLPVPPEAEGASLWPLIAGRADAPEKSEVVVSTAWRDLHAIRSGPYKLILDRDGRAELYDLRSDPEEQRDLGDTERETAAVLRRRLTSLVDLRSGDAIADAPRAELDPGLVELLERLGYGDATPEPGD